MEGSVLETLMDYSYSGTPVAPGESDELPSTLSTPVTLVADDTTPTPPTPSVADIPATEQAEDEDELFSDDPVWEVMTLLNFTVVPRKPQSVLETPLPAGELMPKSQYLEERRELLNLLKEQRQEVVRLQVDKLKESWKVRDLELKFNKVAKVVGEMHLCYGNFLRSLFQMMRKRENEVVIGSWDSADEVETLMSLMRGLIDQFFSETSSLKSTKKVLEEASDFLKSKVPSTPTTPILSQSQEPLLVNLEDDEESSSPLQEPSNELLNEPSTAFIPVVADADSGLPVQMAEAGRTYYKLLEYPVLSGEASKEKKHGLDVEKNQGGCGLFCVCGQSFQNVAFLKYHIRYFNAQWKFRCCMCSRKYPGKNFLRLHLFRTHNILCGGADSDTCVYCQKSFGNTAELLQHLKASHEKSPPSDRDRPQSQSSSASVEPEVVDLEADSSNDTVCQLNQHTSSTASTTLVVNGTRCACGVKLGSRELLIQHLHDEVDKLGQFFKCNLCTESISHPCTLKSHFRETHGLEWQDYMERNYGCAKCEKVFTILEELEAHIIEDHSNENAGDTHNLTERTEHSMNMETEHS